MIAMDPLRDRDTNVPEETSPIDIIVDEPVFVWWFRNYK